MPPPYTDAPQERPLASLGVGWALFGRRVAWLMPPRLG